MAGSHTSTSEHDTSVGSRPLTLVSTVEHGLSERLAGRVLPEDERPLVQRKLRQAWAKASAAEARSDLDTLARRFARQRPGAAASLREGLDETLTVNRLGVTDTLLRTLSRPTPSRA